MAREFRMGARIDMADGFSDPVSRMSRTTRQFGDAARSSGHNVDNMSRSAISGTGSLGAFTAGSRAAGLNARGLAGGVASVTASLMGLTSVLGIVMGMLTAVSLYHWLIDSNAEMEQFQNTLTVVLKSSERAAEMLEWASKFAAQTPFEIPQVVEATTKLEMYGISAQKTLGTIGDMASVMGKPLMQAVEAVADAQTGEIERLKEFGITKDMLIAQGTKMGTNVVDSKGTITDMVAFNAALFTLMEDRYKGGMEMQSKSFKGMISNVADFIGTMGREFGKPIFDRMKNGLANSLSFLDKIKENGTMEAITAKAQAFGISFADSFGAAFGLLGNILGQISDKVGAFMDNNAARFALIGATMGAGFALLSDYATPILNWLLDTAFPATLTALSAVGTAILAVAEFFIVYWQPIAPFVEGIAIAFGLLLGPGYAIIGMMYVAAQATRLWAAAQLFLNTTMLLNPTYWLVIGIGLLIGAGIWLVQNWGLIKSTAADVWDSCSNYIVGAWDTFTAFVSGAWDSFTGFLSQLAAGFVSFAKMAATAFLTVMYFINPFVYLGVKIAQNWGTLGPIFAGIWASITQPVVNVYNAVVNAFSNAWNYVVGIGSNIVSFYVNTWQQVIAGVVSFLGPIVDYIANIGMSIAAFFVNTWNTIVADIAAYFGPAVAAVTTVGQGITGYFGTLIDQAFTWGGNIIDTMLNGVLSAKDRLVNGFMSVFGEVRQLMPFSDAKQGPFSQLTYSGGAIMSTMAEGVTGNAGTLYGAMNDAFGQAPGIGDGGVSLTAGAVGSIPISASAAAQTAGGSRTTIGTLIGQLTITGTDKDAEQLANEIIEILHDRLSSASEIASAGMGALL